MTPTRSLVLATLLALHLCTGARAAESVKGADADGAEGKGTAVELDRWRLLQRMSAVDAALGAPFRTQDGELHQQAYRIGEEAYLVAGSNPKRPGIITALQLTGRTDQALPFLGLRLGDSRDQVIAALGEPSSTTAIDEPPLTRYDYAGRNYTVELDAQDRLYSIRMTASEGVLDARQAADAAWRDLREAILSEDFARLEPHLRPDVEIATAQALLAIERPYREWVQAPDTVFVHAFFAEQGSVAAQLRVAEPESHVRLVENLPPGLVFKFPQGEILQEIVLMPYDGRYRIYEVQFRAPPGKTGSGDGSVSGTP